MFLFDLKDTKRSRFSRFRFRDKVRVSVRVGLGFFK